MTVTMNEHGRAKSARTVTWAFKRKIRELSSPSYKERSGQVTKS